MLVALDAFGVKGQRPLTYRAAFLVLVLEALLVVTILAVVIAGSRLPSSVILWRFAPGGVLIAVLWVVGPLLLKKADTSLPFQWSGWWPWPWPRVSDEREWALIDSAGSESRDPHRSDGGSSGMAAVARLCRSLGYAAAVG